MIRRRLPLLLAAALILAGGVAHGVWTSRWALVPELQQAVARLPQLPRTVGTWEGTDLEPDESLRRVVASAEITTFVQRRYVDRRTGEAVSLFVACGPTGPISTHGPEACYNGGGRVMVAEPAREEFEVAPGKPKATFLVGDFRQPGSSLPVGLKIYWSWRGRDRWEWTRNARVDFASARSLYKIYVIREMAMPEGTPIDDRVTPQFLRALLPALETVVFADGPPARA
jgi:hypothetical protein